MSGAHVILETFTINYENIPYVLGILAFCLMFVIPILAERWLAQLRHSRLSNAAKVIGFGVGDRQDLPSVVGKLKLVRSSSGPQDYRNVLIGYRRGRRVVVFDHECYGDRDSSTSSVVAIEKDQSAFTPMFIKRLGMLEIHRMHMDNPDFVDFPELPDIEQAFAVLATDKPAARKCLSADAFELIDNLDGANTVETAGQWLMVYGASSSVSPGNLEQRIDQALDVYDRIYAAATSRAAETG